MDSRQMVKCERCGQRERLARAAAQLWNATFVAGRVVGYRCPDCQSPSDHLEAEVNLATTDYGRSRVDEEGRVWAPPT